jgi:uroporphyrin-III C-methyltransferase
VSIVGGGPGDPGLITVTGLQRLREADVVLTDRLAPLGLLEQLAPGVTVVDAAKVPGGPAMRQDHINHALVEHARAGRAVVRLKGGDPFVFGRGREEVEACLAAGVPVEVVPGVTSAISVPAGAGIPVTHRGVSQGFCVLAGHAGPGDSRSSVDWGALARSGMTLVLLMAIDHLAEIVDTLISAGLGGGTPAAVVSDGWSRRQRVVTAPLRDLAQAVRTAGVTNPAVVVVGDVAGLAATGLTMPGAPLSPGGPLSPGTGGGLDDGGSAGSGGETGGRGQGVSRGPDGPERGAGSAGAGRSAGAAGAGRRVLVLGGARSGKSVTAERLLGNRDHLDYVACGPRAGDGDPDWADRVRLHRERRPSTWTTVETLDLEGVLAGRDLSAARQRVPVLVDCLSTWLAGVMDESGLWAGAEGADKELSARVDGLLDAWRASTRLTVVVSN